MWALYGGFAMFQLEARPLAGRIKRIFTFFHKLVTLHARAKAS